MTMLEKCAQPCGQGQGLHCSLEMSWFDTGQTSGTHESHLLTLSCQSWAEEGKKIMKAS